MAPGAAEPPDTVAEDCAIFPEGSKAFAAIICVPEARRVVSRLNWYGGVFTAENNVPSIQNSTFETAPLLSEATAKTN